MRYYPTGCHGDVGGARKACREMEDTGLRKGGGGVASGSAL